MTTLADADAREQCYILDRRHDRLTTMARIRPETAGRSDHSRDSSFHNRFSLAVSNSDTWAMSMAR